MLRPLLRQFTSHRLLGLGLLGLGLLGLAAFAPLAHAAAPVKPDADRQATARLDTYLNADGNGYFALSVSPTAQLPEAAAHDIVVLLDTSASQVGDFRDKALKSLHSMLSLLGDRDRVKLIAIDLNPIAYSDALVGVQSRELQSALSRLANRVPLGSTDMLAGLSVALDSFEAGADSARSIVYIGDGMSTANFVGDADFRALVERLVERRVSVSSCAIGPRHDTAVLAALANQTGGNLVVDGELIDAKPIGSFLAAAATGAVAWPTSTAWPERMKDVYPRQIPPLRADRDTIVVGAGKLDGTVKLESQVEIAGKMQRMSWALRAQPSSLDFAFLPTLVESARKSDGLMLPTIGTSGLQEARRWVNGGVKELAQLSKQALASGNVDNANRLATEALKRDPQDEVARAVQAEIKGDKQEGFKSAIKTTVQPRTKLTANKSEIKRSDADAAAVSTKSDLRLKKTRIAHEQAVPPTAEEEAAIEAAPAPPVDAPVLDEGLADFEAEGGLLADVEAQREIIEGQVLAEVRNLLSEARGRMSNDPEGVKQGLKNMLERVRLVPELTADVRSQLENQLEQALVLANKRSIEKDQRDAEVQATIAAGEERRRVADSLVREQEKIDQLMERFNSLMTEGRYLAAEEAAAAEVAEIAPDLPLARNAVLTSRMTRYYVEIQMTRVARQKAVVDTLYQCETSLMPFPDDQPIIYPDAEIWKELTLRRKKFASVDLKRPGKMEQAITSELDELTTIEHTDTPLKDVLAEIQRNHNNIPIVLDTKALEDAAIDSEVAVTQSLKGLTLRSALRLMLSPLEMTYIIKDEVMLITTKEKANTELITKVYPVADLVLPIQQSGFSGGFGGLGGSSGGMGGMGGGGMGGGMGGGGMGGGMGGMGGGGGGFFSVADDAPTTGFQAFAVGDDLKLGKKATSKPATTEPKQNARPAAQKQAGKAPVQANRQSTNRPAATDTIEKSATETSVAAIDLRLKQGDDPAKAWDGYFASRKEITPEADLQLRKQVRETARQLMQKRDLDQTIVMLSAAIRHGFAQPWMYEAMGIAMKIDGRDREQLERVLMSSLDFQETPEDLLNAAQYMARMGLEGRALKIFQQVAKLDRMRPEPYQFGLKLAQRVGDLQGVQWASLGVLSQAWPVDQKKIVQDAERAAAAVIEQLKAEERYEELKEFEVRLADAKKRDCIVKVTWTGDADVDVLIEEPTGSICSFRNPRTVAGGVLHGDTASRGDQQSAQGYSEIYECPEAFAGTYRMLLRRIWGKVTAGKVTVDIYAYSGTDKAKHMRHQVPVGAQDGAVVFDLPEGRRKEALDELQLANAAAAQIDMNRAILAQQLSAALNPLAGSGFGQSRADLLNPAFRRGAVGYQPVIITLPTGTNLQATGVISADRRYVRITALPLFSQVGQVTTFNIGSGATTTMPPPTTNPPGGIPPGGNPGGVPGGGGGGGNPNPVGGNPNGNPL